MDPARRRIPFAVVLAVVLVVSIAVSRLPETFLAQLREHRPLDDGQTGWLLRLLAIAAVAQALYGGFVALRTDRIARVRDAHPKTRALRPTELLASVARNAAGMVLLTIVYGVAAVALSGERGGYLLFLLVALAQAGWYFRLTADVARWMALQPEERNG